MTRLDFSVYFVVDPQCCGSRAVEAVVEAAVAGGASMVQLRDKSGDLSEVERRARAVMRVLAGTGLPFLVNDYADVAAVVGAQGVHLGQGDMAPERARAIVGDAAIVGWTAFLPEHFSALAPDVVDYAGTGPFYPTLTKPGKSVLGADGFSDLVAMSPVPVVGIGGIVPENAGAVIRAGAAGVAMMRGISEASDPAQAARNYLLAVEAARRDVRLVG